jgi:hypothetical protein
MTNFEYLENKSRSKMLEFLNAKPFFSNIIVPESLYSPYDAQLLFNNIPILCEVKYREMKFFNFDMTMLMETKKYHSLQLSADYLNIKQIMYMFVYDNNEAHISFLKPDISFYQQDNSKSMPKTQGGDLTQISKNCIFLKKQHKIII